MAEQKSRKLAAIMFTDIVGYTALMQTDERTAMSVRGRHREAFEQLHHLHNGEIIQYYGDGTLSTFDSAVQGVECAMAIQRQLSQGSPVVPLRIGLHVGDIIYSPTEVYGDGINVASRIESMGVAGAVLLSGRLNEELRNQTHISTALLGAFEFRNVADPVEVYAVANDGFTVPDTTSQVRKQSQPLRSIAVLPFVNMSSNRENEFFSDGMTEEIINALTKIRGLKVTSRTSSFYFRNRNLPTAEIGRQLNVSTLLQGSIRLAGSRMRITTQLVDVADDYHFWSETFDRSLDDVFAVQDEVSLRIAERLREHLGHFEIGEHLVQAPDVSVDRYRQYLKSRYLMLKMSRSGIEQGLSLLQDVIAEEPAFPLAHLGMHLGYTLLGTIGLIPASEAFARGKPHLDRAIELDEDLPECQLHLSWMSLLVEWDTAGAYRHLNRVLEARPIVDYYQSMASTLVAEGKHEAALNYIETAIQLDPFSDINYHLKGFALYIQQKYDLAIENFRQSVSLKPGSQVSLLYWGQALLLKGEADESLRYFQNLSDERDDLMKLGGTTLAHAALGNSEEARRGIAQLEAAFESDLMDRALHLLILCHAVIGDQQRALDLIEKGVAMRLPMMIYLWVEPLLIPLHRLPRFQELARQILGDASRTDTTTVVGEERRYVKSLLDPDQLKRYRDQLGQLMAADQPYLNPALTLADLAGMLGIPSNYLSQLLNEGFDQNFSEFVNSYRLGMFRSKAADPACRHLTILALAYESGFNSKTVFNTYFKKVMGQTPSAYWKSVVG